MRTKVIPQIGVPIDGADYRRCRLWAWIRSKMIGKSTRGKEMATVASKSTFSPSSLSSSLNIEQSDLVFPNRFGDIPCQLIVNPVVKRVGTFLVFRNNVEESKKVIHRIKLDPSNTRFRFLTAHHRGYICFPDLLDQRHKGFIDFDVLVFVAKYDGLVRATAEVVV